MKPKQQKVLIIYRDMFLQSVSTAEKLFTTVVQRMNHEGRALRTVTRDCASFEDGSKVEKFKFERDLIALKGYRVTHLYVDKTIFETDSGRKVFEELMLPVVIQDNNYANLDAEGSPKDRVFIYNMGGINKYFG